MAAEPARVNSASGQGLSYIPALDGIRGIAALAVFFHHALFTAIHPTDWPAAYRPIIAFSYFGQYGLDLFFVLSGYLITTILIRKKYSPRYYQDFYVHRFTRIIPLYVAVLVIVALFVPGSRGYVILSALFIANFAQLFHVSSLGPFWTLAIEEQFYVIWPLLVRICSRERLRYLALGILIVGPVLRLIDIAIGHHNFQFTFFHADGLAFGALLACQKDRAASRHAIIALGVGMAFYVLSLHRFAVPYLAGVLEALQLTSVSMMACAVVALAVGWGSLWPLRWLGLPLLIFFGQISYCFYLIHLYVFMAFDALLGPVEGVDPRHMLVRFFAVLIVTTMLCVLSRRYIELPALALRKWFA